jgi:hypothetical protein
MHGKVPILEETIQKNEFCNNATCVDVFKMLIINFIFGGSGGTYEMCKNDKVHI